MSWLRKSLPLAAKGESLLDEGQTGAKSGGRASLPSSLQALLEKEGGRGRRRAPTWDESSSGTYIQKPATPNGKMRGKSKAATFSTVEGQKSSRGESRGSKTRRKNSFEGELDDLFADLSVSRGMEVKKGSERPSSSSAALSTSLLAKVLRRTPKGNAVEAVPTEDREPAIERSEQELPEACELPSKSASRISNAKLLLADPDQAVAKDSDLLSKAVERRKEALLRSERLQEMMCESPQVGKSLPDKVDISKMSAEEAQSHEEIYWTTLWTTMKEMMSECSDGTQSFELGLLPGSVELPEP